MFLRQLSKKVITNWIIIEAFILFCVLVALLIYPIFGQLGVWRALITRIQMPNAGAPQPELWHGLSEVADIFWNNLKINIAVFLLGSVTYHWAVKTNLVIWLPLVNCIFYGIVIASIILKFGPEKGLSSMTVSLFPHGFVEDLSISASVTLAESLNNVLLYRHGWEPAHTWLALPPEALFVNKVTPRRMYWRVIAAFSIGVPILTLVAASLEVFVSAGN
ncbi:stage II sporulation protein M [Schleiferilactobacillus shenzhenensis]|nr:stage II sporulation protein M [Schleiferilactobacillus shenzhenensis]